MILTVILNGISKAATVLPILMKVYTIPCHDTGYLYVVLVLQSCSNSLHILPSTSIDTYAASSDCAYPIGNMKFEEDLDMQEEEELNVKIEKGIGGEEDECIGIKDEEVRYRKEEDEEEEDVIDMKEEEWDDIVIKEEECLDIKEEVSLEGTV